MRPTPGKIGATIIVAAAIAVWWVNRTLDPPEWSGAEIANLRSLSLDSLPPLPPDPSNAVADNRLGPVGCRLLGELEHEETDGEEQQEVVGTARDLQQQSEDQVVHGDREQRVQQVPEVAEYVRDLSEAKLVAGEVKMDTNDPGGTVDRIEQAVREACPIAKHIAVEPV